MKDRIFVPRPNSFSCKWKCNRLYPGPVLPPTNWWRPTRFEISLIWDSWLVVITINKFTSVFEGTGDDSEQLLILDTWCLLLVISWIKVTIHWTEKAGFKDKAEDIIDKISNDHPFIESAPWVLFSSGERTIKYQVIDFMMWLFELRFLKTRSSKYRPWLRFMPLVSLVKFI